MLNMGAILDLPSEEWFGSFSQKLTIHVIDSNRPQNLSTLFGSGNPELDARIVLWDDGGAQDMTEEKKAWESILVGSHSLPYSEGIQYGPSTSPSPRTRIPSLSSI